MADLSDDDLLSLEIKNRREGGLTTPDVSDLIAEIRRLRSEILGGQLVYDNGYSDGLADGRNGK